MTPEKKDIDINVIYEWLEWHPYKRKNSPTKKEAKLCFDHIIDNKLLCQTHYLRALIYFPDLLEEFISYHISNEIIFSDEQIAGCYTWYVENTLNNIPEEASDVLIKYFPKPLELLLVPFKWPIDNDRYIKLKNLGFYSYSIDKPDKPFVVPDLEYEGYRHSLYTLINGTEADIEKTLGDISYKHDCRFYAYRDYLNHFFVNIFIC